MKSELGAISKSVALDPARVPKECRVRLAVADPSAVMHFVSDSTMVPDSASSSLRVNRWMEFLPSRSKR